MHQTRVTLIGEGNIIISDALSHEQIADRLQSQGYWTTTKVEMNSSSTIPVTLMRAGVVALYPKEVSSRG